MIASAVLARIAVDALVASGVTHVVLCPGSRSAPLAYAVHDRERRDGAPTLVVRHDERSAAFVALGIGRAGGLAAVVTTSGTAVANLLPAALEAHHSAVPLVLLTADRPPALRGTWANQTTDLQAGLFGDAVRARLDLPDTALDGSDGEDLRLAALRSLADTVRSAWGGGGRRPGPVHLDLGFTEPLLPDGSESGLWSLVLPDPAALPPRSAPVALPAGPRTVVLAGDTAEPPVGPGAVAAAVAERGGWPLLAEPSSGARCGPNAVAAYRLLLELPELGGAVERVVAYGRPTLSRPVTRLLARPDVEVVLVAPHDGWPDPGRPVTRVRAVRPSDPTDADAAWLATWHRAGAAARTALDGVLDSLLEGALDGVLDGAGPGAVQGLPGPLVAREVAAALREGEHLMAAASNPVRDLDLAAAGLPLQVHANRGLSGIDGTVSTAYGVALASGRPVRVLVGDLAFLHDANAFLVPPDETRPPVQVVVLNDGGGGIFSLLEQGERAESGPDARRAFERLFGTPQDVDVAALCAAHHVPHRRVGTVADLRTALADWAADRLEVVEVVALPREGLRDLHARIRTAVHAAAHAVL